MSEGFAQIKLKVGTDVDDDVRRLGIARDVCGPHIRIAVDANQRWEVAEAITWMAALRPFDVAWIEEPTSPDDILGHAAIARAVSPVPVAIPRGPAGELPGSSARAPVAEDAGGQ